MAPPKQHPWDSPGYGDISSASVDDDEIVVVFSNQDTVRLDPAFLELPGGVAAAEVIEDQSLLKIYPIDNEPREVNWMTIRALTDSDFRDEIERQDSEQSRKLGRRLQALREDQGLSRTRVADKLKMKVSLLSRLEKGQTIPTTSQIRAMLRAVDGSFTDISGPDAPEVPVKEIKKRVKAAGVPGDLADRFVNTFNRRDLPSAFEKAFQWPTRAVLTETLSVQALDVQVQYKTTPKNSSPETPSPLLHLARAVSIETISRFNPDFTPVPNDPIALREDLLQTSDGVTIRRLLNWTWMSGIPVIPLSGSGGYVALVWEVKERPVIVLKDPRSFAAFWLFDLAHELGHLALGHLGGHAIVDEAAPWHQDSPDHQERGANNYALSLLLGDYRNLLEDVRFRTDGDYMKFKFAVLDIANEAQVSPGLLGLAAAHEMLDIGQPKDRWGSAMNIAKGEGEGRAEAEHQFLERIRIDPSRSLDEQVFRTVISP